MRILLNGTTLVKGGALQACVAFIKSSIQYHYSNNEIYYVISKEIKNELTTSSYEKIAKQVYVFDESPARNVASRKELLKLESSIKPDVIFTFFGPAYVSFHSTHVCGVADGWVTHSNSSAFRKIGSVFGVIRTLLLLFYKAYWYRKADTWVVEAECAKVGMIERLRCNQELIYIVPNGCAGHYLLEDEITQFPDNNDKLRVLCLSAYYKHKNIEIIPQIAKELKAIKPELNFEFVLTISESESGLNKIKLLSERLGVTNYINNIGPVSIADGPSIYKTAHISILPSVLETFSANYPEAMAMGLPILTTDFDFSRDICGDAALYFNANNAKEAAYKIIELIDNLDKRIELIQLGKKRLKECPVPENKYQMYLDILEQVVKSKLK